MAVVTVLVRGEDGRRTGEGVVHEMKTWPRGAIRLASFWMPPDDDNDEEARKVLLAFEDGVGADCVFEDMF